MIKVIYKYPLKEADEQEVALPNGFQCLKIAEQSLNGEWVLTMWCKVDPSAPLIKANVKIFGTGRPFEDNPNLVHLETVLMNYGLVWHVFLDKTIFIPINQQ